MHSGSWVLLLFRDSVLLTKTNIYIYIIISRKTIAILFANIITANILVFQLVYIRYYNGKRAMTCKIGYIRCFCLFFVYFFFLSFRPSLNICVNPRNRTLCWIFQPYLLYCCNVSRALFLFFIFYILFFIGFPHK